MRKKDVKRRDQQPSPHQNTRTKPTLLIRPQGFSLEMENLFFLRRLTSAHSPSLKGALHIVLHLSGALVVVGMAWFMLSEALIYAHPTIEPNKTQQPEKCVIINRCSMPFLSTSTSTVTSRILQTPSPVVQVTPKLMPEPTKITTPKPSPSPSPSPDPTLPPTVTPATPLLQVAPKSLTISLASICVGRKFVILILKNAGGAPLVWFQDKTNSSQGIKILDPTKTHLLQPGASVDATVSCLSTLTIGLYNLAIDYNGGAVNVPVTITL